MKNPAFRPQRLNYVASVNAARKTAGATCPHCGEGGIEQAASRCPGCNYQLQWEINFGGGDWPLVDAYDDGHVGSRRRRAVRKTALDWSTDVSDVLYDIVPEEMNQIAYYGEFMLMVSYNTVTGQWNWYVSNDEQSVDKAGTAWSESDAKATALEVAEDAEIEMTRLRDPDIYERDDRNVWL